MTNKKPHPYKNMISFMNRQRNITIEDFRSFKRSPINREYMPHSAFDATRAVFRAQIAELDLLICLARLAVKVSARTGIVHLIDTDTKVIYSTEDQK